jgi:hypothetical protein
MIITPLAGFNSPSRWRRLVFLIVIIACGAVPPVQASLSTKANQSKIKSMDRKSPLRLKELSQGYTLLRELMEDEANVSQALILRTGSKELEALCRDISSASKSVLGDLRSFAKADRTLVREENGLPTMEKAARESISGEITRNILWGNKTLSRQELLLSQIQATEYGQHLLLVIANQEFNSERREVLQQRANTWKSLRQRVRDMVYTTASS